MVGRCTLCAPVHIELIYCSVDVQVFDVHSSHSKVFVDEDTVLKVPMS